MKLTYGLYLTVTVIVLVNLLIAMMSDTYQRIQSMSDIEWKFGRAILIRQMNKRSSTPAPLNMFTKCYTVLKVALKHRCYMLYTLYSVQKSKFFLLIRLLNYICRYVKIIAK